MKRVILVLITFIVAATCSLSAQTKTAPATPARLTVYYFHATQRCATCLAIEENARKALQKYFPEDLNKGTIRFESVNIDEKANYKLAEKYEAGGSALWLTLMNNGKEVKKDMTNFAFSYGRSNPEKFMAGMKDEISKLLK